MKIVILSKMNKKNIIIFCVTMVIILVLVTVWESSDLHSKVDRSTAMQVSTVATVEAVIPVNSPDFFTEYRLERDKIRSERSDLLRETIKHATNDDSRMRAQENVLKLITEKEKETEMESLIKARGFSDSLVFIRDNSVSAIIKASSLSREEVVQVADVISRVAGIKAEDISISAKP